MSIVVGMNPKVFIRERGMIVSRGLEKLTELGISFSIHVSMEKDAEDDKWQIQR